MISAQKACPVVTRATEHGLEILAFRHPAAGCQFVKGTIEKGELPHDAAIRELLEESGLVCPVEMAALGTVYVGPERVTWHFFNWRSTGLPDRWEHATDDDGGHKFVFFWHPVSVPLDEEWHRWRKAADVPFRSLSSAGMIAMATTFSRRSWTHPSDFSLS